MTILMDHEVLLRVSGARTYKLDQLLRRLTVQPLYPAVFLRIVNYIVWREVVYEDDKQGAYTKGSFALSGFFMRALHALPTVIMYLSNSLCSFVNPQGGSCWQLSCPILSLGQCALRLMCAFQDSAYDCNRLLYRYCMNGFSPALQPT